MDIFPFVCATDKVWIIEQTLIHKCIGSVPNSHVQVYRSIWRKTHYVTDKNINVSSEGLNGHYQKFSSCPIGLSEILAIMSVSTFNIAVILYMYFPNTGLCRYFLLHSFQQLSWLWSVWRMWGHPRSSWPKPCVPENTTTCSSW